MPKYVMDLACGHRRLETSRKMPRFFEPSETGRTVTWCLVCQHSQTVLDVRQFDGSGCDA